MRRTKANAYGFVEPNVPDTIEAHAAVLMILLRLHPEAREHLAKLRDSALNAEWFNIAQVCSSLLARSAPAEAT
jgi:hypothetical protein